MITAGASQWHGQTAGRFTQWAGSFQSSVHAMPFGGIPLPRKLVSIIRPTFWCDHERTAKEILLDPQEAFCGSCLKLAPGNPDWHRPQASAFKSVSWEPDFVSTCQCYNGRVVTLQEIANNPALLCDFVEKWQDRVGVPIEVWLYE
jgi:hypothetical protein